MRTNRLLGQPNSASMIMATAMAPANATHALRSAPVMRENATRPQALSAQIRGLSSPGFDDYCWAWWTWSLHGDHPDYRRSPIGEERARRGARVCLSR